MNDMAEGVQLIISKLGTKILESSLPEGMGQILGHFEEHGT